MGRGEPRTACPKLRASRVPWSGPDEDYAGIWSVTCLVCRASGVQGGQVFEVGRPTPYEAPVCARGRRGR